MSYKIAIPSLKRSKPLQTLTYALLKKHNIDLSNVYIFVIDSEYELYKECFPESKIVIGRFGAKNNKNYIQDYFKQGEYIIQLDDDIKDLFLVDSDTQKLEPIEDLENFIFNSLSAIDAYKCNVLGVYPIKNGLFMLNNKETISSNLNYLCGACLIYLNNNRPVRSVNLVEDYEYSLLSFLQDGKVLRNNRVCVEANQYTLTGGLQYNNNRNKDNKHAEIMKLKNKYPDYIALVKKHNGQPDIKFKSPSTAPAGGASSSQANRQPKKILRKKKVLIVEPEPSKNLSYLVGINNVLHTYYTGDTTLPSIFNKCLNSWLKLEYKVVIHTNININDLPKEVVIQAVTVDTELLPAQQADLVRFKYLSENAGASWIDFDIFLVRRIPDDINNIISSEQPNRKGGYKSEKTDTPNIGFLRLEDNQIFKMTLNKCYKAKVNKVTCYMNIFLKLISKCYHEDKVVSWRSFCPLDWSNLKESFTTNKLVSKYGKELISVEEIKNNEEIYGVHLWNSFIQKNKLTNYKDSSFMDLLFT